VVECAGGFDGMPQRGGQTVNTMSWPRSHPKGSQRGRVGRRREVRAARSGGGPAHVQAPGVPGPRVSVARAGHRRSGPVTRHDGMRQGDGRRQGRVERLGSGEERG
jgi:hypothetical protein